MQQSQFTQLGELLREHETVLVTGPTGCGKSTQVPLYLLREFENSKILMTLPRRLAVSSLLKYIEQRTDMTLRTEISYEMARCNYDSPLSRFLISTAGSAVSIVFSRPAYYDIIILDEIHEMSSEILQLLVICSEIQATYGTKIVLMSATVDKDVLAGFADTCVFEMQESVNAKYRIYELPMEGQVVEIPQFETQCQNYFSNYKCVIENAAEQTCLLLTGRFSMQLDGGDILVFVPGISDFNTFERMLTQKMQDFPQNKYQLLFIHSKFSNDQKSLSLASNFERRTVIVSTNICETSLTLPTISFVVDTCLTKQNLGSSGNINLHVVAASNEALIERAGRVGRCKDGCYIPCFTQSELSMVPAHYNRQDIISQIPGFIIEFLTNSEQFGAMTMNELLDRYAMKLDRQEVTRVLKTLSTQQVITEGADGIRLSNYGKSSEGDVLRFCCAKLGIYELALMLQSTYQPDLNVFVDPFEIKLNCDLYVETFESQPVVNYLAYEDSPNSLFRLSDAEKVLNQTYFDYYNGQMLFLQTFEPCYSGFSDMYAASKVVALWREYFPIPTAAPTGEEVAWCRARMLNCEALRQFELNVISGVCGGALQDMCTAASYIEQNMVREIYPLDREQLIAYFDQIGYNHNVVASYELHQLAYKSALIHFGITPKFCVTRLLEYEARIGITQLECILTSINILINQNATFYIDSRKYKQLGKMMSKEKTRDDPTQQLRIDLEPGVKEADLGEVYEKRVLSSKTSKFIRFSIAANNLMITFNCNSQEAISMIFALFKQQELRFDSGSTTNMADILEEVVHEEFSLPEEMLPSQLTLNANVAVSVAEEEPISDEKTETSDVATSSVKSPNSISSQQKRHEAINLYQIGAVFTKRNDKVLQTQPFLQFDNFAVMTYENEVSSANRHFISQQGFAVYICSFVYASNSRFMFEKQAGRIVAFELVENDIQLYSCSNPNEIEQAVLLCLHWLTVLWAEQFDTDATVNQFSNAAFLEEYDFAPAAVRYYEKYVLDLGEQADIRSGLLGFVKLFGGLQDEQCVIGCFVSWQLECTDQVPVYVCK